MSKEETEEALGFQFPTTLEITVFGEAVPELEAIVLAELKTQGTEPDLASVRHRSSREGKYLAVSVSFWCESRSQYMAVQNGLRANAAVRWVL